MNCVASFVRMATEFPGRTAVIEKNRLITYGELLDLAQRLAGGLRRAGFKPGDRVALILPNSIEYLVAALGCWLAGFVVAPLNTAAHDKDLNNLIGHAQARLLIYDATIEHARNVANQSPQCETLAIRGDGPSTIYWEEIKATEAGRLLDRSGNDLAMIIYTSGTTGIPKGVMLSHDNLIANTKSIISYLKLVPEDRTLCVLPFFYSYGNSLLHTHMASGASLVLENQFLYPQKVMERIAECSVTGFSGVPATFALLLGRTELEKLDLSDLRYLTQAGGPMPVAHQELLSKAIPHAELFIMYGQTEATARISYLPPEKCDEKKGSVGIAIPGVTLEIRDRQGNVLQANEEGEVCIKGKNVMLGYWRDKKTSGKAVRNDWLHTGDMGYLDNDGFLFLTGRNSDFIKTGAHRISPVEIEEVISQVEGVREVAVTSVPDDMLGEVLRAVVVPDPSNLPTELAIKRQCRENLATYKIPRIVDFVETLPRTASGKLRRQYL